MCTSVFQRFCFSSANGSKVVVQRGKNIPSLFQYQNISAFAIYLQVSELVCEGIMSDLSRMKAWKTDELYFIRVVLISKSTAEESC